MASVEENVEEYFKAQLCKLKNGGFMCIPDGFDEDLPFV